MRIAIVGAGISGLTAAYHLARQHDVTVFESQRHIGGHTHTVSIPTGGVELRIDTGFIVFNDRTYPNFCRMLDELRVAHQETTMSFSVQCEDTGLEYNGTGLNGFFAQRRNVVNPAFFKFISDFFRFGRLVKANYGNWSDEFTVGAFFRRHAFGALFRAKYFLPMASAIWSCPQGTIEAFPIKFIAEFYLHHGLLGLTNRPTWRVIRGGSKTYVDALVGRLYQTKIHTETPVVGCRRESDCVRLQLSDQSLRFDHVIIACHSDQALAILGEDATSTERDVLSAFPYERNVAVLHTDANLLPRSRRAWASWNYFLPKGATQQLGASRGVAEEGTTKATVTYNMNLLQNLDCKETYCVTLNGENRVHPDRVLRRIVYHHPVFTTRRSQAQASHKLLTNANRTSFCGAYWGNGFHEDGVNSALAVIHAIQGQETQWRVASTRG